MKTNKTSCESWEVGLSNAPTLVSIRPLEQKCWPFFEKKTVSCLPFKITTFVLSWNESLEDWPHFTEFLRRFWHIRHPISESRQHNHVDQKFGKCFSCSKVTPPQISCHYHHWIQKNSILKVGWIENPFWNNYVHISHVGSQSSAMDDLIFWCLQTLVFGQYFQTEGVKNDTTFAVSQLLKFSSYYCSPHVYTGAFDWIEKPIDRCWRFLKLKPIWMSLTKIDNVNATTCQVVIIFERRREGIEHVFAIRRLSSDIYRGGWLTLPPRTSTCPTKKFEKKDLYTPRDLSNKLLSQYGG